MDATAQYDGNWEHNPEVGHRRLLFAADAVFTGGNPLFAPEPFGGLDFRFALDVLCVTPHGFCGLDSISPTGHDPLGSHGSVFFGNLAGKPKGRAAGFRWQVLPRKPMTATITVDRDTVVGENAGKK
jgi:hypothetical protein